MLWSIVYLLSLTSQQLALAYPGPAAQGPVQQASPHAQAQQGPAVGQQQGPNVVQQGPVLAQQGPAQPQVWPQQWARLPQQGPAPPQQWPAQAQQGPVLVQQVQAQPNQPNAMLGGAGQGIGAAQQVFGAANQGLGAAQQVLAQGQAQQRVGVAQQALGAVSQGLGGVSQAVQATHHEDTGHHDHVAGHHDHEHEHHDHEPGHHDHSPTNQAQKPAEQGQKPASQGQSKKVQQRPQAAQKSTKSNPASTDHAKQGHFVPIGRLSTIHCVPHGIPNEGFHKATYEWLDGKDRPLEDPRFTLMANGTLKVKDAQPQDGDNYTCAIRYEQYDSLPVRTEFKHEFFPFQMPTFTVKARFVYKKAHPEANCTHIESKAKAEALEEYLCKGYKECPFVATGACLRDEPDEDHEGVNAPDGMIVRVVTSVEDSYEPPHCIATCVKQAYEKHLKLTYIAVEELSKVEAKRMPPGKFKFVTDSYHREIYEDCPPGFKPYTIVCLPCLPGTFSPPGSDNCILCPMDHYQNKYTTEECYKCPNNKQTKHLGTVREDDCLEPGELKFTIDITPSKGRQMVVVLGWVLMGAIIIAVLAISFRICMSNSFREKITGRGKKDKEENQDVKDLHQEIRKTRSYNSTDDKQHSRRGSVKGEKVSSLPKVNSRQSNYDVIVEEPGEEYKRSSQQSILIEIQKQSNVEGSERKHKSRSKSSGRSKKKKGTHRRTSSADSIPSTLPPEVPERQYSNIQVTDQSGYLVPQEADSQHLIDTSISGYLSLVSSTERRFSEETASRVSSEPSRNNHNAAGEKNSSGGLSHNSSGQDSNVPSAISAKSMGFPILSSRLIENASAVRNQPRDVSNNSAKDGDNYSVERVQSGQSGHDSSNDDHDVPAESNQSQSSDDDHDVPVESDRSADVSQAPEGEQASSSEDREVSTESRSSGELPRLRSLINRKSSINEVPNFGYSPETSKENDDILSSDSSTRDDHEVTAKSVPSENSSASHSLRDHNVSVQSVVSGNLSQSSSKSSRDIPLESIRSGFLSVSSSGDSAIQAEAAAAGRLPLSPRRNVSLFVKPKARVPVEQLEVDKVERVDQQASSRKQVTGIKRFKLVTNMYIQQLNKEPKLVLLLKNMTLPAVHEYKNEDVVRQEPFVEVSEETYHPEKNLMNDHLAAATDKDADDIVDEMSPDVSPRQTAPSERSSRENIPSASSSKETVPTEKSSRDTLPSEAASEERVPSAVSSRESLPSVASRETVPSESPSEENMPSPVASSESMPTAVVSEERLPSEKASRESLASQAALAENAPSEMLSEQSEQAAVLEELAPSAKSSEGDIPSADLQENPPSVMSSEQTEQATVLEEHTPSAKSSEGDIPSADLQENAPSVQSSEEALPVGALEENTSSLMSSEEAMPAAVAPNETLPSESLSADALVPRETDATDTVLDESVPASAVSDTSQDMKPSDDKVSEENTSITDMASRIATPPPPSPPPTDGDSFLGVDEVYNASDRELPSPPPSLQDSGGAVNRDEYNDYDLEQAVDSQE